MNDDRIPRVTLRGEFLRAERMASRAVAAEAKVRAVERLADRWEQVAGDDRDTESRTLRAVVTYIRHALAEGAES